MTRQRFLRSHPMLRLTWPLFALVAVSIPFAVTDLDVRIASLFWDSQGRAWALADSAVVKFIYDYGTWPAWAAVYFCVVVFVAGQFLQPERPWRRPALFFVLAVILGPGILVNAYGKTDLGRPRPRQIEQFGGESPFQRLGHFQTGDAGASFPSGHASMGFVWLAPAFYFRARRAQWARGFLILALVHGGVLGLARMAAGGHFASDVLWSAGANCAATILLCLTFGLISAARGREDEFAQDVLGIAPPATAA
jgi:membrane-associated PAP2 superfamily phosphatase